MKYEMHANKIAVFALYKVDLSTLLDDLFSSEVSILLVAFMVFEKPMVYGIFSKTRRCRGTFHQSDSQNQRFRRSSLPFYAEMEIIMFGWMTQSS